MKIELLVPKTIRVERDTDNILNDGNFILNGIDYESPGLVVILTALNQDIKIQKDLYKKGIYSWYRRSNEKDHADIHGAFTAYGHTKKDILNVFTLRQGNSIVVFNHLHRPYFEQIYKEQGYKAIVGVSGQLAELKEIDPFIEFTNPYKNDKNIWQEPFTVCQEIEWSYAD